MSEIPQQLKYTASHEWVRHEADDEYVVGITHHAQSLLGDIVFLELPALGAKFACGDEAGVIESVKAASDIYAPIAGEVIAINDQLEAAPETVNQDPYGAGWLFKLKISQADDYHALLDAKAYEAHSEEA